MKKILFSLSVLVLLGFLVQSCKKDSTIAEDVASKAAAEDITADNDLGAQIDLEADNGAATNFAGAQDRNDCPVITLAHPRGTWPNTITLDYSAGGCTKPDGRVFKGQIIIEQSDKMSVAGATRTFTFVDFSVDGVQIAGSRVVTNNGLNADGQPSFTRTGSHTLTYPDGSVATHTGSHTLTLVEGFGTPLLTDDVWNVTGTGSGVNRNGVAYTVNITKPLVKRFICPWTEAGVVEVTVNSVTRSLDYGDGTCDNDATLTRANGSTKDVKIRHHWWR